MGCVVPAMYFQVAALDLQSVPFLTNKIFAKWNLVTISSHLFSFVFAKQSTDYKSALAGKFNN